MTEVPLKERLDFYNAMVKSNTFSRGALAVAFILLYRFMNGRTGRCDPSIAKLAEETGLAERSVKRALRELKESEGWLIGQEGAKGRGYRNSYVPQLERVSFKKFKNGHTGVTHSDPERVSSTSPIRREKGDKVGTKRVSPASPEPVREPVRLSRSISSTMPDGAAEQFEDFWRIYPSRGCQANPKKPARQSFLAAIKRGADPADIVAGAEAYAAMRRTIGGDRRFTAQAVTWLNQERWNDQPSPAPVEPPWPVTGMIL
jgi:helix-turn-helix protein